MSVFRPLPFLFWLLIASCATTHKPIPAFCMDGMSNGAASTVRVNVARHGHGSGVIISADRRMILTSEHIIRHAVGDMLTVTVRTDNGIENKVEVVPAEIMYEDPGLDLAVLWIDKRGESRVKLADDAETLTGNYVYSIGYPGNRALETVRGVVRKTPFSVDMRPAEPANFKDGMLADMDAKGGMAGAGVFSAATGKLIGINTTNVRAEGGECSVIVSTKEIRRFLRESGIIGFSDLTK